MLHVCLIVVFASLVLRDQAIGPSGALLQGVVTEPLAAFGFVAAAHLLLALTVHLASLRALRQIERTNRLGPIETLDTLVMASRLAGAVLTSAGICLLGTLDGVRSITGDTIALDEAITVSPFLLMVVCGWWSSYPVERLVRDSTLIRDLDEGRPVYSPPSRGGFVWGQVRHQLMILLVPMTLLLIWSESVGLLLHTALSQAEAGSGTLAPIGAWMQAHEQFAEFIPLILQVAGLGVIAASSPLLIRRLWDTHPLRDGTVAEGLIRMCTQQGVVVRGLLVWRTGGTMINGAVLGLFGKARYILLTDALLDFLPNHYVQAVMAHEIGHVRCKHVPWLTATLFASSGAAIALTSLVTESVFHTDINHIDPAVQLTVSAAALGFAVFTFGWVSRRFEWQADAFAVKHLSTFTPPSDDTAAPWAASPTVTRQSIAAMCGALETVAVANHLPRSRFTFRHGSIATRIERLLALEGVPLHSLPIDTAARRVKWGITAGCLVVVLSVLRLL